MAGTEAGLGLGTDTGVLFLHMLPNSLSYVDAHTGPIDEWLVPAPEDGWAVIMFSLVCVAGTEWHSTGLYSSSHDGRANAAVNDVNWKLVTGLIILYISSAGLEAGTSMSFIFDAKRSSWTFPEDISALPDASAPESSPTSATFPLVSALGLMLELSWILLGRSSALITVSSSAYVIIVFFLRS